MRGFAVALLTLQILSLSAGCSVHHRPTSVVPVDAPGRTLFESYCAACHGIDGQGVEGEAPPLTGSSWVSGPELPLIRIALNGVAGPIQVNGKTYNREMPGFGSALTDDEIAALVSFVRSRFAESSPSVDPATVTKVREASRQRTTFWTADELRAQ